MRYDILSTREQIQEDLRCILDGQDQDVIDRACQCVVDRMKELLEKNKP